jgi:hypothetical protein
MKTRRLFEDISREMEEYWRYQLFLKTFSEKLRLLQGLQGLLRYVSVTFIKPIAAAAFWSQSDPECTH